MFELLLVLQRPEYVRLVEPVAHRHPRGHLGESVHHLVVDGVVHVQPLECGASLSGVDKGTPEQVLGDGRRVGIREDDARVVAAELKSQAREVPRRALDDLAAGGRRPCEHHLVDVGMRREARADLATARDRDKDVSREHLVQHADEGQHAERCELRRLDDDGVAHSQARRDLPDGDHHRPVPRPDRADHAHGAVGQLRVRLAVIDDDLRLKRSRRRRAQPSRARADLEPGVGPVERLALLAREQRGQRLGIRVHSVGGSVD